MNVGGGSTVLIETPRVGEVAGFSSPTDIEKPLFGLKLLSQRNASSFDQNLQDAIARMQTQLQLTPPEQLANANFDISSTTNATTEAPVIVPGGSGAPARAGQTATVDIGQLAALPATQKILLSEPVTLRSDTTSKPRSHILKDAIQIIGNTAAKTSHASRIFPETKLAKLRFSITAEQNVQHISSQPGVEATAVQPIVAPEVLSPIPSPANDMSIHPGQMHSRPDAPAERAPAPTAQSEVEGALAPVGGDIAVQVEATSSPLPVCTTIADEAESVSTALPPVSGALGGVTIATPDFQNRKLFGSLNTLKVQEPALIDKGNAALSGKDSKSEVLPQQGSPISRRQASLFGTLGKHSVHRAAIVDASTPAQAMHAETRLNGSRDGSGAFSYPPAASSQTFSDVKPARSGTVREGFANADDRGPILRWTTAGIRQAEAGFQDPSLGWISVRAQTVGGGIHATVVPPSDAAAQLLNTHIASLNAHVNSQDDHPISVTLGFRESGIGDQGASGYTAQNSQQGHQEKEEHSNPGPFLPPSTLNSRSMSSSLEIEGDAAVSGFSHDRNTREGHLSVLA